MRINTRNILRITLVFALFASAMVLTGCSQENPKGKEAKLNLFTWEGMFPQDVLDEFTAETGIAINHSNFDYNETMLAKLEAAKGGDYDLVIADDYILETVFAEGLAQELDRSKISNFDNINPVYQGQFYDPDNEYTVPYGAGVQTIVYNPDEVDIEITGYADLGRISQEQSGHYRKLHINGMALKFSGELQHRRFGCYSAGPEVLSAIISPSKTTIFRMTFCPVKWCCGHTHPRYHRSVGQS